MSVKNLLKKKDVCDTLMNIRLSKCNSCPTKRETLVGDTCGLLLFPSDEEGNESCGCLTKEKVKHKNESCPQGKW